MVPLTCRFQDKGKLEIVICMHFFLLRAPIVCRIRVPVRLTCLCTTRFVCLHVPILQIILLSPLSLQNKLEERESALPAESRHPSSQVPGLIVLKRFRSARKGGEEFSRNCSLFCHIANPRYFAVHA